MFTRFAMSIVALGIAVGCQAADGKKTYPLQILIIRHAEKPEDGVSVNLSEIGKKRADALPELFEKSDARPDPLPTPDFIIATKASKHSNRPVETVVPLAKKLKLDIDARFANDDYPALVKALFSDPKYVGKVVLICWHHGNIPELAEDLRAGSVPDKWKDSVFDRVWVITYNAGKGALTRRPQLLLPGDSTK